MNNLLEAFEQKKYSDAEAIAYSLMLAEPNSGILWKILGASLHMQGKPAIKELKLAVDLLPNDCECHNNLGIALQAIGEHESAIVSFNRIIELNKKSIAAMNNISISLQKLNRSDEALTFIEMAVSIDPNNAIMLKNSSLIYKNNFDFVRCEAALLKALEISPDYPDAKLLLGTLQLLLGNFSRGWFYYESRFHITHEARVHLHEITDIERWNGQSLHGKRLLVCGEQGLGDEIQFSRYLIVLNSLGVTRLSFACSDSLVHLLKASANGYDVFPIHEQVTASDYDYWVPLLSVPFCLGHLGYTDIPTPIPYLKANNSLVSHLKANLARFDDLKVGVCWSGSTKFLSGKIRSIGIEPFKPLFSIEGVRFVCLQMNGRKEFLSQAGPAAIDLGHEIDEFTHPFEETTALIESLDLVITCDTSIAHLAGALGKPVWLALPYVADWRWMLDREDSPWYPHTRLFRQTKRESWSEVFDSIHHCLTDLASAKSRPMLEHAT